MNLTFTPSAWDDYQWFVKHDRKLLKRINQLIEDILRDRLVYTVKDDTVVIIACRYHYSD
jgi:toxin YoeB